MYATQTAYGHNLKLEMEAMAMEADFESEAFLRTLSRLTRRLTQSPTLRKLGYQAARRTLKGGLGLVGRYLGKRFGGSSRFGWEDVGKGFGAGVGTYLGSFLPDTEVAMELVQKLPLSHRERNYLDALLETLGEAAVQAKTESEMEACVGSMVPLSIQVTPQAAPAMLSNLPYLLGGVSATARYLYDSPQRRPLLRVLPSILHYTAASMHQRLARGKNITPHLAIRLLAYHTAKVLSSSKYRQKALRHSHKMPRKYHLPALGTTEDKALAW